VVKLPRGSHAESISHYAIHTRISGAACVGAKIDGMRFPLWTAGEKTTSPIEIITAQGQTTAGKRGLDYCNDRQGENGGYVGRCVNWIARACQFLGRELARLGFEADEINLRQRKLLRKPPRGTSRLSNEEEFARNLGRQKTVGQEVVQAVYPNLLPQDPAEHVRRKRAVLVGLRRVNLLIGPRAVRRFGRERMSGLPSSGPGRENTQRSTVNALSHYEDQPEIAGLDLRWHDGPHPAILWRERDLTIGNAQGVLGRICTLNRAILGPISRI